MFFFSKTKPLDSVSGAITGQIKKKKRLLFYLNKFITLGIYYKIKARHQ